MRTVLDLPEEALDDLPEEALDAGCHALAEFLIGLAHDAEMPAKLKAKLMYLACQQLVADLAGDLDTRDRITAEGQALCGEYNARRKNEEQT
jgi:hypothetical protein